MDLTTGLIAAVVGLVGLVFYTNSKRKSSEALLENTETKKKLLDIDKNTLETIAELNMESMERSEAERKLNDEKKKDLTIKELENFFNRNTDK